MKALGFTLIELLVVIMVLSVVGSIVTVILVSTLQGSQKTTGITDVRQSGTLVMSIVGRMIRNSQKVNSCAANVIDIMNPDGGRTVFSCQSSTISSNSASLFPTSVLVSNCIISCTPPASPEIIQISFTAEQSGALGLQKVSIPFKTSIQLRNF